MSFRRLDHGTHRPRGADRVLGILFVMLLSALIARAQDTKPVITRPSSTTQGSIALTGHITGVRGLVEIKLTEKSAWIPAKEGMIVDEGTEFRTGPRSAVQFVIEPDQTITLDRLGTMKLLTAVRQATGKIKTDVGMKYGRTRYDISAGGLEHESTIRSPNSALGVRGTKVSLTDTRPFPPEAVSLIGQAEFQAFKRESLAFGGKNRAAIAADKSSAAQHALLKTKVDPHGEFSGRSGPDDELLLYQTSGGLNQQSLSAINELARISDFKGSFIGVPSVPGPLSFQLDWFSTAANPGATNLDLLVTDPSGHTASAHDPIAGTRWLELSSSLPGARTPSSLNPIISAASSNGMHLGDDKGLSGLGSEGVSWGLFFPAGKYTVQAIHRGGDDALVFITVTQGVTATAIKTFGQDPLIILKPGESFTGNVTVAPSDVSPAVAAVTKVQHSAPPARDSARSDPGVAQRAGRGRGG